MNVPKCIECNNLYKYTIGKHTYYDCYHSELYTTGKKIYAKYIKTSPGWCPKRKNDNYMSELLKKYGRNK